MGELTDEIGAALARWRHNGGGGLGDDLAGWVVEWVSAAGPRSAREARDAARYLGEYVTFRVCEGLLLAGEMFEPSAVEAYRKSALGGMPKGSADARVSHLKRLAPGVGLAGTTRKRATGSATSAPAVPTAVSPVLFRPAERPEVAAPTPLLRPDVARAIDRFCPEVLDPARFARVRTLVREVVRRARPESVDRARHLMRTACYAAAWLDGQRRPLRADVLLSAETIEGLVAALDGEVAAGSLATYASQLHALREANGIPLGVERATFGSRARHEVYGEEEVHELYRRVPWLPTAKRRRQVKALLDLVFGAGVSAHEAARVGPDDVERASRGVELSVAGRRVLLLEPYGHGVLGAAAIARECGEPFLLGGAGQRIKRVAALLEASPSGRNAFGFDVLAAQNTWLVTAAADERWYTPAEFLAAAGRGALGRLQRLAWAGLFDGAAALVQAGDDASEVAS